MVKVSFVQACFGKERAAKTVHVPTGERKRLIPFFRAFEYDETLPETRMVDTGEDSDSIVDGARLARDLQVELATLEGEGFAIQSVIGVVSGAHQHEMKELGTIKQGTGKTGGMGYGYGYSYTEGLLIVASKG